MATGGCWDHFENALRLLPFGDNVAIVGSFALWEWLRHEGSTAERVEWLPGDVDVFVTGGTQATFDALAKEYLAAAQWAGIPLMVASKRSAIVDLEVVDDACAAPTDRDQVGDVLVPKPPAISFVRCRRADLIADVPDSFDIDVCRVVLRITPGGARAFVVSEEVRLAIESQTLTVFRDISLQTAGSIKCRARVAKYEARGFRVTQGSVSSPTTLAAPFTYFTEAEERRLGVSSSNLPEPLEAHRFSPEDQKWMPWRPETPCRMVITMGSAAAGKSTLLQNAADEKPELQNWRWVDLDAFLELGDQNQAPTPAEMAAANDRVDLHELPAARAALENVVWDTTGMNRARLLGGAYRGVDVMGVMNWPEYTAFVIVVVCHPAVALARNRARRRKLSVLTVVHSWICAYKTALTLTKASAADIVFVDSQHYSTSLATGPSHPALNEGAIIIEFDRRERAGELYKHLAADTGDLSSEGTVQLEDFCNGYVDVLAQLQSRCTSIWPEALMRLGDFWQLATLAEVPDLKARTDALQTHPFSVISYNLWGDPTAREARLHALVDLLVAEHSDVVCLQEVTQATLTLLGNDARI